MEDEQHIGSFQTGLAVGDYFFCGQQHMRVEDLLPAVHQLVAQCDGMIKQPGIYAFRLEVSKIK